MQVEYYYSRQRGLDPHGPVSVAELGRLFRQEEVTGDFWINERDDDDDWTLLNESSIWSSIKKPPAKKVSTAETGAPRY